MWELVQEYSISLDSETCKNYWNAFGWPNRIANELEKARDRLAGSKNLIQKQMHIDREHCMKCIEAYEVEIEGFYDIENLETCLQVSKQVKSLRERINHILRLVESVNSIEKLVGDAVSDIVISDEADVSLKNLEKFWYTVEEMTLAIDRWLDTYFMDLHAEEMLENMDRWKRYRTL